MMETEIWPNLLRECRRRGVKSIMITGLSSLRSYSRYRLARPFFRRVLADVDRFCMQSEESARRLIDLGAPPSRVSVTGSLKFDSLESAAPAHAKPRERVMRFFRLSPSRTVIVAGSTLRGEEAAVLRAFTRIKGAVPSALTILAPRHPERFGDQGGHNILEPAIFGKPIVFGPHMQNFKEIAEEFLANGAAVQISSDRDLESELLGLITDPVRRARLGAAARALVEANRGAKAKTLDDVHEVLPSAGDAGRRPAEVRPFRSVDWSTRSALRTARRPPGGAAGTRATA